METVVRVAVVYVLLMVMVRVLGKRELASLSTFEFILLILVPELLQQALVREDFSLTNAMVGVTTLFSLVFVTSMISFRSERAARVISGQPTVLVHDGRLIEEHLQLERIAPGELFSEMHKAGIDRLEQVRWAILEEDGRIAIVPTGGPSRSSEDRPGPGG